MAMLSQPSDDPLLMTGSFAGASFGPLGNSGALEQLHFGGLTLVPSSSSSTIDTISLPVTRAVPWTPQATSTPVAAPAGRRPAPLLLRSIVILLAFVVLTANLGLAALRLEPAWLAVAKTALHPAPAAAAATVPKATATSTRFALVSSGASVATYRVPSSHFSIALNIDHPCWVVVRSPGVAKPLLATVLQPGAAPVDVNGSATVQLAAAAKSITISSGGKVLGTVPAPILGTTYTFSPVR